MVIKENEIISWISKRRKLSKLDVKMIPIKSIKNWIVNGKNIIHEKKSYFSIIGVEGRWKQKQKLVFVQPIILQKEKGIMGFMIQNNKILLQAKTEPGNVNGTQIAPSVQATVSNYKRIHGGDETKFLRYFLESENNNYKWLNRSLQLEQGLRFMNKSNYNMIIRLHSGTFLNDLDDRFRWFEIRELLSLLEENYLINTDSRSVLVSCNWEELTENNIAFFENSQDHGFKYLLNESYYQKDSKRIFEILEALQKRNNYQFTITDLNKLKNWRFNEDVIIDNDETEFEVKGFRVKVADREISHWEQPLIHDLGIGKVILYCQKRDGILKFLLNAQIIIGGDKELVWGASVQNTINDKLIITEGQTVLGECMQSDEGGRFYQSKVLYQIVELQKDTQIVDTKISYWATLAEIQSIVVLNKKSTNELRSVLSLLLKFI